VASSEQLKALIKSHISRDDGHFYSVAMQVAAHEAKLGHGKLAEELRDMIDAGKTRLGQDATGKLVAIGSAAKPQGALANLLHVTHPANRLVDMVLDAQASSQLQRIVKEQRMLARIREHGLSPRRKLLLVGPPGTGKTMTASVLAGELGIPLFSVRLDSLITKFMGEPAAFSTSILRPLNILATARIDARSFIPSTTEYDVCSRWIAINRTLKKAALHHPNPTVPPCPSPSIATSSCSV